MNTSNLEATHGPLHICLDPFALLTNVWVHNSSILDRFILPFVSLTYQTSLYHYTVSVLLIGRTDTWPKRTFALFYFLASCRKCSCGKCAILQNILECDLESNVHFLGFLAHEVKKDRLEHVDAIDTHGHHPAGGSARLPGLVLARWTWNR